MLKFLMTVAAVLTAIAASIFECIGWVTLAVRWLTESKILIMPVSTTFTPEKSFLYVGYGFGLYIVAALLFWFSRD